MNAVTASNWFASGIFHSLPKNAHPIATAPTA